MRRNSGAFPNISWWLWNNNGFINNSEQKTSAPLCGGFFMRYQILIFFFLLLLNSCSEAPAEKAAPPPVDSTPIIYRQIDGAKKTQQLDTFFSNRIAPGEFSGCILVAQRGIILYEKAFGWRDREKRDSLQIDHSFQLASVSKQFTAAAVMLLHQQGKIAYEDSVGKFIPGFPWHKITVGDLLHHRGGLEKYENVCDNFYRDQKIDPPAYFNNDSAVRLFMQEKPHAVFTAGEKFKYSNTGYMLLARIVELVSKQRFGAFMKINFFDPVGMKNTWVNGDGQDHPGKTRGYTYKWTWWEDNFLDGVAGDKGVYSSVGDMFLWDRSLRTGKIISLKTQEEAYAPGSPELEGKKLWNYGFGWRTIRFDDNATAVFHNGWWHGYTSAFYRGMSDDVTIVILCNKKNRSIYNTRPILAILGAHHLPLDDEENGNEPDSAATTQEGGSPGLKKKK